VKIVSLLLFGEGNNCTGKVSEMHLIAGVDAQSQFLRLKIDAALCMRASVCLCNRVQVLM